MSGAQHGASKGLKWRNIADVFACRWIAAAAAAAGIGRDPASIALPSDALCLALPCNCRTVI